MERAECTHTHKACAQPQTPEIRWDKEGGWKKKKRKDGVSYLPPVLCHRGAPRCTPAGCRICSSSLFGSCSGKGGKTLQFDFLCPLGMQTIDYEGETQPCTNTRRKEPLCVSVGARVSGDSRKMKGKVSQKIWFRHIWGRCNFLLNHLPSGTSLLSRERAGDKGWIRINSASRCSKDKVKIIGKKIIALL